MNEAEKRAERIDPKLKACGWGVVEGSKVLREYHLVTNCDRFEKIRQALEGRTIGRKKQLTTRSSGGAKYQPGHFRLYFFGFFATKKLHGRIVIQVKNTIFTERVGCFGAFATHLFKTLRRARFIAGSQII